MSTLTDEQRKRIEENRRKALEKRALLAASLNGPKQTPVLNSVKTSNGIDFPKQNSTFSSNTITKPYLFSKPAAILPHKPSDAKSTNKSFNPTEILKCQCILLSRKRFYVDMCFNKEVIDVFKSVPGRAYDMQTKKWNFSINDHDKLVSLMKPLQPNVLFIPLPKPLVKIFTKAEENRQIKEYDLSSMDPFLVNALLPFQKEGLFFGIQLGGRILLADDMGLGKTIQGIAIANYFKKDWPLLVVTPSSVRYSWLEAFHTWLPSVEAHEISVINSSKDHIPNDKVIIMSYDLLSKLQDSIIKRNFKSVIFDESHFLKNHKSARTKAAQAIMKNMVRILMLSGTPALSRPIELFTQLSGLCHKYFGNYLEYGMRYCNGNKMPWGWDFCGSSNMAELQFLLEELVMIRRLKSDVIKQLPSKCRQMIVLDPSRVSTKSKMLKAMFEKMQQTDLRGMERRGALLEYFHETGAVKIPAVCDYVEDLLESNQKFLCFAHHQSVINSICHCIEKKKIDYIRIDGSVASEHRKKLCDHFQLNDTCKVAVLSITAANCGITLTAASLVVFAELFWNPGILTQAEDRAHRIGQEDSVVVQYLVAKGTADDEIWPLVQRKLDILNKAGLSKDNFRSADTVVRNEAQSHLEDFWNDMASSETPELKSNVESSETPDLEFNIESSETPDLEFNIESSSETPNLEFHIEDIPEKRLKLEM